MYIPFAIDHLCRNEIYSMYINIFAFGRAEIRSIINLQIPGEHCTCGPPLGKSGFSYEPQAFMDEDSEFRSLRIIWCMSIKFCFIRISVEHASWTTWTVWPILSSAFFYNYCWHDYGVGSMTNVNDIVRVMEFALSGGKVAIHCHAGLGENIIMHCWPTTMLCKMSFRNPLFLS